MITDIYIDTVDRYPGPGTPHITGHRDIDPWPGSVRPRLPGLVLTPRYLMCVVAYLVVSTCYCVSPLSSPHTAGQCTLALSSLHDSCALLLLSLDVIKTIAP